MLKKNNEIAKENLEYDSMIENGTSEDDSDEHAEESDDDFSEKEDENEKKSEITETKKNQKLTSKRKADTNVQPKVTPNSNTNAKKSKIEKVKPPTLEEINELKETRNLFHSNLFRLQVKEMLTELKIKEKYTNFINRWIQNFKSFINSLPEQTLKEEFGHMQWLEKTSIKMPLLLNNLHGEKRNFCFQFIRPNVEPYFVGAAATETLFGPKLYIDICLTMPAGCFQKEDYLNMIYDQKRALYLVFIAKEMLKSKFNSIEVDNLKFNYYKNNPLKPILEIIPTGKTNAKHKICMRLFIAVEKESFKRSRFVPWNNNIRGRIFDKNAKTDDNLPTPHYNANVLFDLTMHSNQQILDEVFKGNKNLQEGLILLKVWLQQRQLHLGYVGFSSYILEMFICYLYRQHKLYKNMSSYQISRTVWNQLANSTWDIADQGITLAPQDLVTVSNNRPTLAQFHKYFSVVFIDSTGFYNICANVSLEMYRRVRFESKLAMDMLNDMKLNSFQALFMIKRPLYSQFDHILKISKPDAFEQILDMHVPLGIKQDYAGYAYPQVLQVVGSLLQKGLDKRIQIMLTIETPTTSWPCTKLPDPKIGHHLELGFILDPNHAYEVLNKGPQSIDNTAKEFRRFWGDKAKLRRFQDGTITESVVWGKIDDTLAQKRLVSRNIVLHLLQHHFQLDPNDIIYIAGELDIVYKLTPAYKIEHMHEKYKVPQNIDAETLCLRVIQSFDDLARKLHALKGLPLEIATIVGSSPVFRYCEPTPLLPTARIINGYMHASSVQHGIIQLAMSGKWPNELKAFQALKTAFYVQIAELIRTKYKYPTKVTNDGILLIKQGYCFNIEISHPKELALLKESKTERGVVQFIDTVASIELQKRHYVIPKVTGALHALHHQNPSFGGTVMIAKRWLYAQLIDNGLWPDMCTELLVAILYLRTTNQQEITCSPQTGFIRFLQLISNTDWKAELFLLNFNNSFAESQITDLEQRFNDEREQFPPLCIATSYDRGHYGKLWTNSQQPNENVIARVTLLARQALEMIEKSLISPYDALVKPSKLFIPSTEGYDLIIQLRPDEIPNTTAFDFGSNFTAYFKPNWRLPLAGLDLLGKAVAKLREAYGDFAAFFYNPCGGSKVIGVVWKPSAFLEKEFKVTDLNGCQFFSKQKIQCNRETLIEDFKFILKDLYLRIDTAENVLQASKASVAANKPKVSNSKIMNQRYFDNVAVKKTNKSLKSLKDSKEKLKSGKIGKQIKENSVQKRKTKLKKKVNLKKTKKIKTKNEHAP